MQAAVLNGQNGSTRDLDDKLAVSGRAEYRFSVGPAGAAIGGSVYRNESQGTSRLMGGPFGYLHWGRFSWLSEADFVSDDAGGGPVTGLAATQEFAWALSRGVDLIAVHDFHDADVDQLTSAENRFTLGLELIPLPFFQLQALISKTEISNDPDNGNLSALFLAHFFY